MVDVDPPWPETDLYEVLGVDPGASPDEITRAYRSGARSLHPDANPDGAAGDRFSLLAAAYDVLRDPDRRAAYDRARGRRAGPERRPGGGYTIHVQHVADRRAPTWGRGGRHPFGRRGDDVTVTVPISYAEAVLGAELAVPAPDGPPVRLRVPAGTASGRVLRVRGRGAPTPRGRGDLLVTVEIAVPRRLDRRRLEAIRRLADLDDPHLRDHLW